MKRIIITGAGSYIGTAVAAHLSGFAGAYRVETVDMLDGGWKDRSFAGADCVYHVAGIAHVDPDPSREALYFRVNRDLAIETARKARAERVGQFVFMSSIIVYGEGAAGSASIGPDTPPAPAGFYGRSKLEAERGLEELRDEGFRVAILRPPMVYGPGSRGNFPRLASLARRVPVFPDIDNRRSMIYIGNLCEFVRFVVDDRADGTFFPQNREYVKTTDLVRAVAAVHGRNLRTTRIFNPLVLGLAGRVRALEKLFGNLVYERDMSAYRDFAYCRYDFETSIRLTESS